MTPKEKAIELFNDYLQEVYLLNKYQLILFSEGRKFAKNCASIAIDELIKENYPQDIKRCEYWREVKQEIEKL